ncbi:hypothetical protein Bind_0196 [Beijerinckia indica subsp. indica ATCC 9039]|uniref:Uncharacterized protein YtcA n=2 Tax=Beijerinckia TaxID=532 RepID=B2ICG3_BEII9|nr:hypothetical protein Bind_0196 [Beijerinckia indica subsp. indica ATCC 9039]
MRAAVPLLQRGEKAPVSSLLKHTGVLSISVILSGCSLDGAAAFEIAGAYFPGWMFCATLGIFGGCFLRLLFIRLGLDERIPWKLFFYTASSLILTLLSWRHWFGPAA